MKEPVIHLDNATEIQNITPEFLSIIKLPQAGNRKLNYLMVVPRSTKDNNTTYGFPLGIAFVTSALKASGRNVFTLNLNYKDNPEEMLKKTITSYKIDVVMTGGFSIQFRELKMIIDSAKEAKPDVVTVVGGGIISSDPKTAMEALENADYGVIGEGEITVNALAFALESCSDPIELDGVISRKEDGKWSLREKWSDISDLNVLPFPDYKGLEYNQIFNKSKFEFGPLRNVGTSEIAYITTSRSCPFKCTFCFHTCGDNFRVFSLDYVFDQLDYLISLYPEIKGVCLQNEYPFKNKKYALEFCRRIKTYNLAWKCNIHAGLASDEVLSALKDSGCVDVCMGVESADDRILKSMRKNTTISDIEKAFEFAGKNGLLMRGNLIFGDLEETLESAWNSMCWYNTHTDWNINMWFIRAFPGSHIYNVACHKGIIKNRVQFLKDGCPSVNVSSMTDYEYHFLYDMVNSVRPDEKLIDAKIVPQSNYTVNIMARCPHCLNNVEFTCFEYVFNNVPQNCQICGKWIVVNPIALCDFEKLRRNAETLLGVDACAVWAVSRKNIYWLLKSIPLLKTENAFFINTHEKIDYANIGFMKIFEGKSIHTPEAINKECVKNILVPNNPKVFEQIKTHCSAEYPHVQRIVHITELM